MDLSDDELIYTKIDRGMASLNDWNKYIGITLRGMKLQDFEKAKKELQSKITSIDKQINWIRKS